MMTMLESATRHMVAGVEDSDELVRLVGQDTGKLPNRKTLENYRSQFRRYGEKWAETEREVSRRWHHENPQRSREAKQRWKAQQADEYREKNRAASRRWNAENPARKLLGQYRQSARKRGLDFALTVEIIEAMLAPMTCSATGLPLTWEHDGSARANPWAPSIDRVDCSKGYVPGNVRVVCWAFNQMRGEYPDEVVFALAKALAARAP